MIYCLAAALDGVLRNVLRKIGISSIKIGILRCFLPLK
jgi:hypothetical protein